MTPTIDLRRIEEVSRDARVCHFDELAPRASEQLIALVDPDGDAPPVDEDVIEAFAGCDVVKFTAYYEVVVR